jgi:hypothetical protein
MAVMASSRVIVGGKGPCAVLAEPKEATGEMRGKSTSLGGESGVNRIGRISPSRRLSERISRKHRWVGIQVFQDVR